MEAGEAVAAAAAGEEAAATVEAAALGGGAPGPLFLTFGPSSIGDDGGRVAKDYRRHMPKQRRRK